MKKVSRESPLAEITLRKYEKPFGIDGRLLVKKFCLSVGLLQPGDSRDIIVDIFYAILKSKQALTSKQIEEHTIAYRKQEELPQVGIAPSNIRRQIKRLKKIGIIESVQNAYQLSEKETLEEVVNVKIKKFLIPQILERIDEYTKALDEHRKQ